MSAAPPRGVPFALSGAVLALSAGAVACASAPERAPHGAPRDPEPAAAERPSHAELVAVHGDRAELAALTAMLGEPLPAPRPIDPIGVERLAADITRVAVVGSPTLGSRATAMRASAWRDRVYALELTFPEGCPPACSDDVEATIRGWLGPLHEVHEGRVRLLTVEHDTVRLVFEVYLKRPDLVRLLVSCRALAARAAERPEPLPEVGEQKELDDRPPCRKLPSQPLAG